jgi:predicted negative regulator of RcsB-dependent stress response
LLTLAGVAVAVAACFWVAQKASTFTNRADDLRPLQIAELKRSIGQLITLTTVVFTTSTIATIALMQIARDWVEKGAVRDAYIQNGHAMSIFWSANYTCVTALMVILPLWWIAARTRRIQRQAKHAGDRATFWDQIFEVVSFRSVVQAGCATLAPLLTSSFAATFGS